MTEKLPENVEKTLQILAERFGTTVEHLWSVAVRQTYIDALTALILIVTTTVGAYFILKLCKRTAKEDDSYMGEKRGLAGIVALITFATFASVVLSNIGAVAQVLNPEFTAIKLLFSVVK